jgi:hypothetical protein
MPFGLENPTRLMSLAMLSAVPGHPPGAMTSPFPPPAEPQRASSVRHRRITRDGKV